MHTELLQRQVIIDSVFDALKIKCCEAIMHTNDALIIYRSIKHINNACLDERIALLQEEIVSEKEEGLLKHKHELQEGGY